MFSCSTPRDLWNKLHDQSRNGANDECQSLSDKKALDMETIVVIVADHIFGAFEHEMRVVAKPDYIKRHSVPKIHDRPQEESIAEGLQKRRIAVYVTQDKLLRSNIFY